MNLSLLTLLLTATHNFGKVDFVCLEIVQVLNLLLGSCRGYVETSCVSQHVSCLCFSHTHGFSIWPRQNCCRWLCKLHMISASFIYHHLSTYHQTLVSDHSVSEFSSRIERGHVLWLYSIHVYPQKLCRSNVHN